MYRPKRKARTLLARYGLSDSLAYAAARKAEAFEALKKDPSLGVWADFWADVEMVLNGLEPNNLELR